jgi:16S rRNA (uracil1498-N3)-methyltransferase
VPCAAPGARLALPEHSAHHAREVLRLRPGASVRVFDGAGAEFEAQLDEVSRRTVSVRLGAAVAPRDESPLRLVLAVSPLKGDRMELVVQKATELGVAGIWPVVTFRTDAAARPALQGSRGERWERVASGASEQSGRAVVPEVAPTTTLDGLVARAFEGRRVVLLETPGHAPLASLDVDASRGLLLLVGPAGGFEPSEAETLLAAGFAAASLGPRILRAETAAVAAVAIAQASWGDLRS